MHGTLVLFDIDGTLIDTRGAGMEALRRAAHDLHGVRIPRLDLNGATDSGLARDILESFGLEVSESSVSAFYDAYLIRLEENLAGAEFPGVVLPGVWEFLDALCEAGATLGLLTGNIAAGAALKMRHFGLAGYFRFGAYGDDHHDRNELGPVALARAEEVLGRTFTGGDAVVVGDTPKDIACGKALGAKTLAVATGSFPEDELRMHGASLVVTCLADSATIVARLRRYGNNEN